MEKHELIKYILESKIADTDIWHWYSYHFDFYKIALEHPFAKSIVDCCLECDKYIPNFATSMIDNLSQLSGKEKYSPHYEQLLQRLAEMLIIKQLVTYDWDESSKFLYEPISVTSNKNPELVIELKCETFGIEVKSPSLLNHINLRYLSSYQLTERDPVIKAWSNENYCKQEIVFPRDNVIKDFLSSANEKFEGFKKSNAHFYGILVIVWDDYIYEPITSLISSVSGLFTDNSFAKDCDGEILKFNNVDGVVIVRHMHQFMNASGDRPLIDNCKHAFDYGKPEEFPFKAYIPNPYAKDLTNKKILSSLDAHIPDITMGVEYMPQNGVFWFKM